MYPKNSRILCAIGILFIISLSLPTPGRGADSVDVTFRYMKTGIPTPYVAGEFNGWTNSVAPMTYIGTGWIRTVRLAIGGNPTPNVPGAWQYKFYYNGASPWPNDPLNQHVNSHDNDNSFIYTKDPTIYQFLPNQRNPIVNTPTPTISAYIFPKVGGTLDTSTLAVTIDGSTYAGLGAFYDTLKKQFIYPSPPLGNGSHTVILHAGTNADTVQFTVQAGYVTITNVFPVFTWESSWRMNGVVGNDSIALVRLIRNGADTFNVAVSARKFSSLVPLVEGANTITALVDSLGTPKVSSAVIVNRMVNHAPFGRITFEPGLLTVTLHADSSTNDAGVPGGLLTYSWTADSTNPEPIAGITGSAASAIPFTTPATPGEYYFNLVVADTNGLKDTTRNYFTVDDTGGVSFPTLASNPSWVKQGRVYQMFFNAATPQKTINAALGRLDYIKAMGYNIVWVLPVMKNAFPIDNHYGPGYDIVDFYNVAPEYGTNADFKNFVDKAHRLGIKIILDVTPNHTSKYHPFVSDIKTYRQNSIYWNFYQHTLITNPNYHPMLSPEALTSDSLIVYYYPFSDELLNWNWSDLDARLYMIGVYKHWVQDMGVDGFRFDVYWGPRTRANGGNGGENEMGIPVRQALKHIRPDIFLLGEDAGTGPGTENIYADRNGGVDAGYDWNLFHNGIQPFYSSFSLTNFNNSILNFGGNTMGFLPGPNAVYLRFLENQDEERIIYAYASGTGVNSAMRTMPVSTVLEMSVGLPLVYAGQEIGWGYGIPGQKEDRNRSVIDWSDTLGQVLVPHYQRLAQIRKQFPPFWSQKQNRLGSSNGFVLAYSRPQNDFNGLIVSNFSPNPQTAAISLPSSNLLFAAGAPENGKNYYATDLYNDTVYNVVFASNSATLTLNLPPYGSSVLVLADTIHRLTLPYVTTGVTDKRHPLPTTYALNQNYPNPFNPSTRIGFSLPKGSRVTLKIYNVLGQEVATVFDGVRAAGSYEVTWNAASLPSGIYFYRMQAGAFSSVRKMMLVR